MWIRSFRVIKQVDRGTHFISLFELTLNRGIVRHHATFHQRQLTERDFTEQYYMIKSYNYRFHTKKQAEHLYNIMLQSQVNIVPTIEIIKI